LVAVARQEHAQLNSTVSEWLHSLHLDAYSEPFHSAGYTMAYNLADITTSELEQIGVTSEPHQQRMLHAIDNIRKTINSSSAV